MVIASGWRETKERDRPKGKKEGGRLNKREVGLGGTISAGMPTEWRPAGRPLVRKYSESGKWHGTLFPLFSALSLSPSPSTDMDMSVKVQLLRYLHLPYLRDPGVSVSKKASHVVSAIGPWSFSWFSFCMMQAISLSNDLRGEDALHREMLSFLF